MAAMDSVEAQETRAAPPPAFAGQHQPKPLKFDPARLDGLSERLVKSHWENNYIGSVRDAITVAFGSFATWEAEFRRTGMSLAGGSGWTILAYNLHTRSLHTHWAWDHMHGAAAGVPLLALDMYEHSFHMDYGTQAARYIDAWFKNLDWEAVDRRYEQAAAVARS